jgi:hypothetical protein
MLASRRFTTGSFNLRKIITNLSLTSSRKNVSTISEEKEMKGLNLIPAQAVKLLSSTSTSCIRMEQLRYYNTAPSDPPSKKTDNQQSELVIEYHNDGLI